MWKTSTWVPGELLPVTVDSMDLYIPMPESALYMWDILDLIREAHLMSKIPYRDIAWINGGEDKTLAMYTSTKIQIQCMVLESGPFKLGNLGMNPGHWKSHQDSIGWGTVEQRTADAGSCQISGQNWQADWSSSKTGSDWLVGTTLTALSRAQLSKWVQFWSSNWKK